MEKSKKKCLKLINCFLKQFINLSVSQERFARNVATNQILSQQNGLLTVNCQLS